MKRIGMLLLAILGMAGTAGCGTNAAEATERKITVVSREDGSGTRGAFIELFGIEEKGEDGAKKDRTAKSAVIANKTGVMLTNIANDPEAIGYVSLGSLNSSVKALAIDGVEATAENVKNGTYPVARPFMIATKGEAEGLTQDFISFILSKEGQAVAAASYIAIDENASAFSGEMPEGKIVVTGSSSVTPVMEKLKEAYLALNPQAEIEIQMTDSTAGLMAVADGTCHIGMASRGLKESETAQLTGIPIALDGIAVIVNAANPLDGMTSGQVKQIFTGEMTTWSSLE